MSNKNTGNGHRHSTATPDVSNIRNVEVTYEHSDIHIGGVLAFMAALTVAAIIISIGTWLLFDNFQAQAEKETKPGPMALSKQELLPPPPRLQAAPGFAVTLEKGDPVNLELREPQAEYRVVRSQWEQALATGLRDQTGNVVGMPIDAAMKSVVAGLPARIKDAPVKLDDYAISVPSAASSGRTTEKRLQ